MNNVIDINIELYQENIGFLGMQGSGKTHLARKFLDRYPRVPRLIVSPQKPREHFGEYGYPINKISEIENNRAMLWTGDFTQNTFDSICDRISNEITDMLFVVDDCHEYCTKQQISSSWERVIQSKRNDGIFGMYLTPAPNRVNPTILQSLKHIFAFRMGSYSQVEWMQKNYFHNDAWILLEKRLRKDPPEQHADIEYLAKGSYIYRGFTDTKTQFYFSEFQNDVEISEHEQTMNEIEDKIEPEPKEDLNIETTETKTNMTVIEDDKNGKDD